MGALLDRSAGTDDRGAPRQPIFNIPASILCTVGALLALHALRQVVPDGWDEWLSVHLAFVPGRLTYAFAPDRVTDAVLASAREGAAGYRLAQEQRYFLGDGAAQPWTTLTYAVLHADWAHVGLNGLWLLAFGAPVARRFGALRTFAFLGVTAWAGAAVFYLVHPLELAPVIGASAAVSGCMGATLRFMFQPEVPIAAMLDASPEGRRRAFVQPSRSLAGVLADRRAQVFLVAWFATNLLFGLGSISFGLVGGSVAWEAHIGGFMAGMLLFAAFDPVRAPAAPAEAAP